MAPALPDESEEHHEAVSARRRLLDAGADGLPRFPWQRAGSPPDDLTLLRYALERANAALGRADHEELRAALQLVDSARADLDALEAGLLLVARAEGLTWPDIAQQLGVNSPQAAQQRFQRVSSRTESGGPPGRPS
ncbi:hypothetical protein GCM10010977_31510 [Citricoccus zhacaiensis]|uniref:DNA-binding protein n=1 Tax=Citricoccus zhacaiensis TaxID=489142 RepID=A0ABQ2MCG9_9MICC|nr:hypothetical protein [Citricoccus zhacaiensis]GGO49495.1 hypothetical protein GCM10010977_31510 [Citricoccus zhacaiensis]